MHSTWLICIEQELLMKLISPVEQTQQSVAHVIEGLLASDTEKRGNLLHADADERRDDRERSPGARKSAADCRWRYRTRAIEQRAAECERAVRPS